MFSFSKLFGALCVIMFATTVFATTLTTTKMTIKTKQMSINKQHQYNRYILSLRTTSPFPKVNVPSITVYTQYSSEPQEYQMGTYFFMSSILRHTIGYFAFGPAEISVSWKGTYKLSATVTSRMSQGETPYSLYGYMFCINYQVIPQVEQVTQPINTTLFTCDLYNVPFYASGFEASGSPSTVTPVLTLDLNAYDTIRLVLVTSAVQDSVEFKGLYTLSMNGGFDVACANVVVTVEQLELHEPITTIARYAPIN